MERKQFGAWSIDRGFAFRVWAPHAELVEVVGDFNEFTSGANLLSREDDGNWYGEVYNAEYGHQYRYLIHRSGETFSRIDPYAVEVTNSVGNAILANLQFDWGSDDFRLPGRTELVIYEMHVGTFHCTQEGRSGTFAEAIEKLDHLQMLGVNAIELMPCAEFAGDFSWGYNPAHIFAVEQAYGGPLGLKQFVKEAHQRGIGVIMDVVYNHFGPSDLSLWQFDGWHENDKGGIYFYNDWRSTTPWGDTRPDYGRPEVRRYIADNARFWLEEYRMDGLRFDMTLFIRHVRGDGDPAADLADGWSLTQDVNRMVHTEFPGRITIAEDLQNNEWLTKSPDEGGAGFDLQWDAGFVHPVRFAAITPSDEERSIDSLKAAIGNTYNGDSFQRVIYTESHDEVANGKARVPYEIDAEDPNAWHAKKRATAALALALCSPGVPMLFQGQELLEDEWFRDTRPMQWHRYHEQQGIVLMVRDLIHLRKNAHGNSKGLMSSNWSVLREHHDENLLVIHRWWEGGPNDDVIVLINFSSVAKEAVKVQLPQAGKWSLVFNSDWKGYSEDFGNYSPSQVITSHEDPVDINLAPYSVHIMVFDGHHEVVSQEQLKQQETIPL